VESSYNAFATDTFSSCDECRESFEFLSFCWVFQNNFTLHSQHQQLRGETDMLRARKPHRTHATYWIWRVPILHTESDVYPYYILNLTCTHTTYWIWHVPILHTESDMYPCHILNLTWFQFSVCNSSFIVQVALKSTQVNFSTSSAVTLPSSHQD